MATFFYFLFNLKIATASYAAGGSIEELQHMEEMIKEKKLLRIGATRSGHWEVL